MAIATTHAGKKRYRQSRAVTKLAADTLAAVNPGATMAAFGTCCPPNALCELVMKTAAVVGVCVEGGAWWHLCLGGCQTSLSILGLHVREPFLGDPGTGLPPPPLPTVKDLNEERGSLSRLWWLAHIAGLWDGDMTAACNVAWPVGH